MRWIPTDEALPEHGQRTLIKTNYTHIFDLYFNHVQYFMATFELISPDRYDPAGPDHKPYCWRDGPSRAVYYFGHEVTHWMKLPLVK
jgi:hypothetical protein